MTSFLCIKSQKQCSERASYCKVKTAQFQRENHNHETTHYQHALGESGKNKLPFNRKKTQAEPGKLIMSHSCLSPVSSSLQTMAVVLPLLFRATTLHPRWVGEALHPSLAENNGLRLELQILISAAPHLAEKAPVPAEGHRQIWIQICIICKKWIKNNSCS